MAGESSLAVIVNPKSAFQLILADALPQRARVTFTNEDQDDLGLLTYQIT